MIETKDCQICCETFESGGILRYFADLDNKAWCLGHVTFCNSSEEIEASLAAHEQRSDTEFTQRQAEVMGELDGIPVQ